MNAMGSRQSQTPTMYSARGDYGAVNPWAMQDPHGNSEDLSWLI